MRVGEQLRDIWRQATGGKSTSKPAGTVNAEVGRATLALPALAGPAQYSGRHLPKATPASLRRFAETPLVRRAINVIKDRIAAMDWQVRVRRGVHTEDVNTLGERLRALRRMLEEPNDADSFRTLIEQVI